MQVHRFTKLIRNVILREIQTTMKTNDLKSVTSFFFIKVEQTMNDIYTQISHI